MKKTDIQRALGTPAPDEHMQTRLLAKLQTAEAPQAALWPRVVGTVVAACMLLAVICVPMWVLHGDTLFGGGEPEGTVLAPGTGDGDTEPADDTEDPSSLLDGSLLIGKIDCVDWGGDYTYTVSLAYGCYGVGEQAIIGELILLNDYEPNELITVDKRYQPYESAAILVNLDEFKVYLGETELDCVLYSSTSRDNSGFCPIAEFTVPDPLLLEGPLTLRITYLFNSKPMEHITEFFIAEFYDDPQPAENLMRFMKEEIIAEVNRLLGEMYGEGNFSVVYNIPWLDEGALDRDGDFYLIDEETIASIAAGMCVLIRSQESLPEGFDPLPE